MSWRGYSPLGMLEWHIERERECSRLRWYVPTADDVREGWYTRPLHEACCSGNLIILDRLITLGLPVGAVRDHDCKALRLACRGGHLDIVDRLLNLGLTVEDARARDNAALRAACAYGHLAVLERLLSLGLTADDARADNNYALKVACEGGQLDVLERLIELGLTADDARRPSSEYVRAGSNEILFWPCEYRYYEVVARLLELGVVPTPEALVCLSRQVDDDEWSQRLWRAIDRWEGSQELHTAESGMWPDQLEAWEAAKAVARPCRLDFSD